MAKRTDTPPVCKCGCGEPVSAGNDPTRTHWRIYAPGHYRPDAPYKHEEWLRPRIAAGRTHEDIGRECGVGPAGVTYYAKKFGLKSCDRATQWFVVHDANPDRRCELCGGPTRSDNRFGVCTRTEACCAENSRRSGRARRATPAP